MANRSEFQVLTGLPPEEFLTRLSALSAEGWEVAAFEAGGAPGSSGTYTALLSRDVRKGRKGDDSDD